MIQYDTARAKAAVQYLVDSSYFHHHIKKLRNTVDKPRAMPFKDDAEVLNELLVIGRQNVAAMENLIAVAEFKRGGKNEYQREYMAAKRKRDRKVLDLEEAMTGSKLAAEAKLKVLRKQYVVWNKERDALMKSIANQSWTDRNNSIREFWDRKEAEVDALLAEAKRTGPVKKKQAIRVVKAEPKTGFGKALANAIKK